MTHSNCHSGLNSLNEWLFYLESIHPREIDMGLDRITIVAQRLNICLAKSTVITVAGTNGKGTTCAFLENALLSEAFSVAVYSSPHIECFNERLRINQKLIDDQSLISAFQLIEQTRADVSLTYYEYTTLAALLISQQRQPDFIILEVGLGGRLDATNLIDSDLAVITSIDLDHQNFLGNDRVSIGIEKAGIVRANRPVIIGDLHLPAAVLQFCLKQQAQPIIRDVNFFVKSSPAELEQGCWNWQYQDTILSALDCTHIPQDNVATALTVLTQLGIELNRQKANLWIAKTKVPGRTEVIQQSPLVVLDVGHNPHAARYLAKFVQRQNKGKVHAIVGMLADKDISATLTEMLACVDVWYVGGLDVARGADKQLMASTLKDLGKVSNSFDNIVDAYRMALDNANNNDMILVFGSFFSVAKIKQSLF